MFFIIFQLNRCEDKVQDQLDEINALKKQKLQTDDEIRSLKSSLDGANNQLSAVSDKTGFQSNLCLNVTQMLYKVLPVL